MTLVPLTIEMLLWSPASAKGCSSGVIAQPVPVVLGIQRAHVLARQYRRQLKHADAARGKNRRRLFVHCVITPPFVIACYAPPGAFLPEPWPLRVKTRGGFFIPPQATGRAPRLPARR